MLVGDQADPATLASWVKQSGGNFDVIIDDGAPLPAHASAHPSQSAHFSQILIQPPQNTGGHTNVQIWNSFDVLFHEALLPGGIYFIEDMLVGRTSRYDDSRGKRISADVLKSWIDQLAIPVGRHNPHHVYDHVIPPDIQAISCAASHCAIHKK